MTNIKIINTEWIKEALIADPTMNPVERQYTEDGQNTENNTQ